MNFNELEKVCLVIKKKQTGNMIWVSISKQLYLHKHSDLPLGDSKSPLFF